MIGLKHLLVICGISLVACQEKAVQPPSKQVAVFEAFEYSGNDTEFESELAADQYRNPVLAGFYPDPSIERVGEDFYMVNSTFGFFPGVPLHHSTDLVNWTQLGNIINRADMMPYEGLHLGQNGIYAPTISYNDGTFYMATTCVGCGGNFIVTTTDPKGEWSDPIWLPHIGGIDPSLFFDEDGRVYIVHQGLAKEPLYEGHSAIWVMEVDPKTFDAVSDDVMLIDSDVKQPWHTEWIEGPHIYKVEGKYILSTPGGGTGYYHGQLVYRSDSPMGPFEPYENNPILTQLGLPDNRENAVTATGHADFIDDGNGNWWAVFLATRPYDLDIPPQDPGRFHTGRETFLLPITWKDGWPIVLEKGEAVPMVAPKPALENKLETATFNMGNFSVKDNFDAQELAPQWLFIRAPRENWWKLRNGQLQIETRADRVGEGKQPSFVGRRLQHKNVVFETEMTFQPRYALDESGMLAIQNSGHYYAFGLGV